MLHLALLNKVLQGSGDIFDGHVRIDAVLVKQIDDVGLQPLERVFGDLLDVLWTTVQPSLLSGARIEFEPELGGDLYLVTHWSQRFAYEFLISKRTVDFSSVEEGYAAVHGGPDEGDHLLLVRSRT